MLVLLCCLTQVICEIRSELGHVQQEIVSARKNHINVSSCDTYLELNSPYLCCNVLAEGTAPVHEAAVAGVST